MSEKTEFINKHKKDVIEATFNTNLFPSVKMAQMIIESGWGKSTNAKLANNYFGIKKGVGWTGETIALNTPKDAKKVNEFRKYPSVYDSIVDHSSFLIKNGRYEKAGVFKAKTPEEQIKAIANAGYAENKSYPETIISIIESNDLKKLDEEAKKMKPKKFKKILGSTFDIDQAFLSALLTLGSYILYTKIKKK
jgi:flagellum-specific peptidoglycan hydrolase FlgJ